MAISGGCLCGAVAFEVEPPFDAFTHCYCERCRRASGAGRASVLITEATQLHWTRGDADRRRWDLPSASSFATSFCTTCGCHLPRLTRDGRHAVIPAGSLNGPPPITPQCHEHWASRAQWVCLDESELPVFDGDAP